MKRFSFLKYLLSFAAIFSACSLSLAQREKNNIYLFDCTGSMKTNGLWNPAQAALDATITTQTSIPGSQVLVIPFVNNPYEVIGFSSSEYQGKKNNISKAFDKYIAEAKYTHISDVLKEGFDRVNPNMDNKIYLLTDGMPNSGDSPEKVAQTITNWCANHRNCRLFYVALTEGVVNPVIRKAIDACPDAFIVQCQGRVIPQIADISSDVYTNLEELSKQREISFSLPGEYPLQVSSSDPLFNVSVAGNKASDGKILISLAPKNGHDKQSLHQTLQGKEDEFPVTIQCTDKRFFIANPTISVHVADEIPSRLMLAQGQNELKAESVEWHDAFLWSDAAPDSEVEWNLQPLFENHLNQSVLRLQFKADNNDFQAFYNGNPIANGDIINISPDKNAILKVVFNHDAATGKRYFNLVPQSHTGIDMINDSPADQYEGTSLRTRYDVGWNPLKTLLFWLAIALAALLILWLIVLKRIFFPVIRMGKVELIGPGSYYASKRIRGARKIVFTTKKRSQNFLSRLFTGEIKYVRADHFSPELEILPGGGKRKVRVRSSRGWDIYPTSILGQYEKATAENIETKEKMEMEFS